MQFIVVDRLHYKIGIAVNKLSFIQRRVTMNKQETLELDAKMSQEHLDVLNIIKECKDDAITRKQIVAILGKDASYFRQLNIIINDLVVIFKEPIGSASNSLRNGYFYCRSEEDFYFAKASLYSRVNSIGERLDVIVEIEKAKKREKFQQ